MTEVLYITLGWLFGLLSPGIAERIRRRQRQADIIRSIVAELGEVEYTFAAVSWKMHLKREELDNTYLDWIRPVIERYRGPERSESLVEGLKKLREAKESDRHAVAAMMNESGRGFSLKKYHVPFSVAHGSDLSLCPVDFQRAVHRVTTLIDLFNQEISFQQGFFQSTFDSSIVGTNRDLLDGNIKEGYRNIATGAESVIKAIDRIRELQVVKTA